MSTLLRILYKIAPPVHKHPSRAVHQWAQWDDPYRPLEPGEDGCGPVRVLALFIDAELHGPMKRRKLVIA